MPGFAIYFGSFEAFKKLAGVSDDDKLQNNFYGLTEGQIAIRKFLSGGFAGVITWTIAFPADTIKTKIQTAKATEQTTNLKLMKRIIKRDGFMSLYRGIHVQLLRAFPNGACSFFVLDFVKGKLREIQ